MTAVKKYNAEQLMNVVLAPVVSEKSTFVADKNRQYVFRVADRATKPQIKAAVELMFKIKVDGVTVLNVRGKERRFGKLTGRKRNWKKAYVRLAEGQEINFAATEYFWGVWIGCIVGLDDVWAKQINVPHNQRSRCKVIGALLRHRTFRTSAIIVFTSHFDSKDRHAFEKLHSGRRTNVPRCIGTERATIGKVD